MRTLKFTVDAQSIRPSPGCDFSGLVPGTEGYLQAEFSFSPEWDGCRKAAAFYKLGEEYAAPLVNNVCVIPAEALTWKTFGVAVAGVREGYRIQTGKIDIRQEESNGH